MGEREIAEEKNGRGKGKAEKEFETEGAEDEGEDEEGEGWLEMEDDTLVAFNEEQFLLDLPEEELPEELLERPVESH